MSTAIAKAHLIGKVCSGSVKMIDTKNEKQFLVVRIYVSQRVWGGRYTKSYHQIKMFGKLAQLMKDNLNDGDVVYADGRMEQSEWEKKDGKKQRDDYIVVDSIQNLSKMMAEDTDVPGEALFDDTPSQDVADEDTDNLPFV